MSKKINISNKTQFKNNISKKHESALSKSVKQPEPNFANAPLKKKIGFFSSIIIVIGSVMGAGIFFKSQTVLQNSHGSILFAIFCWLISVLAVVLMAMALIEIVSARNDNLSLIGWCKTFNSKYIYKACKNFMVYIYIPLTFFFLPLYFIQSIQNGILAFTNEANINESWGWIIISIGALFVTWYFTIGCGLSSRLGNIQNTIITALNFIPVIIAIIAGIYGSATIGGVAGGDAGVNSGLIENPIFGIVGFNPIGDDPIKQATFASISPGLGLFIGIGAIFFAYDGFYATAGIQSEMKDPKKTPLALLIGLLVITIVYLSVAIAMSIGSTNGSPTGLQWVFKDKWNAPWLYGIFQILIGIGVLSIINGFGMWAPRFLENLIRENELPFSIKYIDKLNSHRPKVGVVYSLICSTIIIVSFCIIGALGYLDVGKYGTTYGAVQVAKLYSFSDLIGTWASVGAFTFIVMPIIGAIQNRKTNKVYVQRTKSLVPCGIGSIIIMIPAILMTFIAPIADLIMLYRIPYDVISKYPSYDPSIWTHSYYIQNIVIPRVMTVLTLFIILSLTILPIVFENVYLKNKYGSVLKGEIDSINQIAKKLNMNPEDVVMKQIKSNSRYELRSVDKAILKKDLSHKELEKIIYNEKHLSA